MPVLRPVTVKFSYTEEIVPPRCRKPRPTRFHDGSVTVLVRHASDAEAPVAIRSRGIFVCRGPEKEFSVEYRWFAGSLWTAVSLSGIVPRGRTSGEDDWDYPALPAEIDARMEHSIYPYCSVQDVVGYTYRANMTQRAASAAISDGVGYHLCIDGVWHRPASEPRYVVQTFGLGNNHGGTAVFVDSSYNPNISDKAYFGLFEREEALKAGTATAEERGDTKSLPMKIHGDAEFDILIAEAVRIGKGAVASAVPFSDPLNDYRSALRTISNGF